MTPTNKKSDDQGARIEALLVRLVDRLPPPDSPFADNGLCHLRKPGIPCRCRAWIEVIHTSDTEAPKVIGGCRDELFPFMVAAGVTKSNQVLAEVGANRRDVQELAQQVHGVQREVIGGLNRIGGAVVGAIGRAAGAEQMGPASIEATLLPDGDLVGG